MAHGQPDFGMYAIKEKVASLADMADLAVRLGSIVEYDRRGDVLTIEDFEGAVQKFAVATIGDDSYARHDHITAKSGSQCVKLYTGANIGDLAEITLYTLAYPVGKWGIKISGMFGCSSSYNYIRSEAYDGTDIKVTGIRLDAVAKTISYLDSGGHWQPFYTDFSLFFQLHCFHNAKLVVDYKNNKYDRFMLNEKEWDLSGHAIQVGSNNTLPHHRSRFSVSTQETTNTILYLEDFVFTVNEP